MAAEPCCSPVDENSISVKCVQSVSKDERISKETMKKNIRTEMCGEVNICPDFRRFWPVSETGRRYNRVSNEDGKGELI